MVGRELGSKPIAHRQEVGFVDRLKHDLRRRHHHPVGHRGNPERPSLPRPARLANAPQRSRPIPGGELVEEVADPEAHDVVDRYAIDARGPAVSTDLAPSSP
jgi:hypothetical protein